MTISNVINKVSYTGDGTESALTVTFIFYDSSDIVVTRRVTATGVETVMALTTNYTVSGGSGATGTVTPVDGATDFPSTVEWHISRSVPRTQPYDGTANDAFAQNSVEEAIDKNAVRTQDIEEQLDRSLHFPVSDATARDPELPNSVDRVSKYLGFDSNGDPVALAAPTDTTTLSSFGASLGVAADDTAARVIMDSQEDVIAARGDIVRGSSAGVAEQLTVGSANQVLHSDGTDAAWAALVVADLPDSVFTTNLIVNGACRVWQRGTPIISTGTYQNDDDSYVADHVVLLSDGDDIVDVSQETTDVPTGAHSAIKLDVETIQKKFGLLFPLEAKDAAAVISGVASLSFKAKIAVLPSVRNLHAVVLAWSSTADSITSDVVSAWGIEATEPTWAANWTREGSAPTDNALSTSWQTFTIENVSVDTASAANVAVFIWCDETDMAVGEFIYIADVQLERGATATAFHPRPIAAELALCRRYFQKSFPQATAPAQNTGSQIGAMALRCGSTETSDADNERLSPVMFATPTVTTYNPNVANGSFRDAGDTDDATVTISGQSDSGFLVVLASMANSTTYLGHFTAEAEM